MKTILSDEALTVECKLPLTQLVEEIDRIADYASAIERAFQAQTTRPGQQAVDRRRAH